MKNKDVENKIYSSLQDRAELNDKILDSARLELKKKKAQRKPVFKYAFASIVLAMVAVFVVLPTLLTQFGGLSKTEYSSLKTFLYNNHVAINTLKTIDDPEQEGYDENYYSETKCYVYKLNDELVLVEGHYTCEDNADEVTIFIILSRSENVEKKYFAEYTNLNNSYEFYNVRIQYTFSTATKIGKASFMLNGYIVYLSIISQNESSFILHIQNLIRIN